MNIFNKILLISYCLLAVSTIQAQSYSDNISVNFFMLDECMISQKMTSYINDIYEEYNGEKFQFMAYFPNATSKPEKIKSFVDKFKFATPYQTDFDKKRAKTLGASRLPEVVVKDEKNDVILYRGRINNLFDEIGTRRRVITQHDLINVLKAIQNKEKISTKETTAIGCLINFNEL